MLKYAFIAVFAMFFASPVAAEIAVQDGHVQTDPGVGDYYDIYSRRIEYGQENVKFRRDMEERRKNYTALRERVLQQFRDNMKAANSSNEPGQSEPEPNPENEFAGPPAPGKAGF